jgi:hypothetical protein
MEKQAKRKKHAGGRPRIDPDSVATFHLGLSFSDALRDEMLRLVARANERLVAQGLPGKVTASSLARVWIEERMLAELQQLAAEKELAPQPPRKSVYDWIKEHGAELRAARAAQLNGNKKEGTS